MRKDHEPYASIFGSTVAVALVIPCGLWLKGKADEWTFLSFAFVCLSILGVTFLIGYWMDKREGARSGKEAEQFRLRGLDLPKSDYRNLSSPGKPE